MVGVQAVITLSHYRKPVGYAAISVAALPPSLPSTTAGLSTAIALSEPADPSCSRAGKRCRIRVRHRLITVDGEACTLTVRAHRWHGPRTASCSCPYRSAHQPPSPKPIGPLARYALRAPDRLFRPGPCRPSGFREPVSAPERSARSLCRGGRSTLGADLTCSLSNGTYWFSSARF